MLSFLIRLLSATNGIETLEIKIIWFYVVHGRGKDLFLPETGWSTLDETLALKNFDSLRRLFLSLFYGWRGILIIIVIPNAVWNVEEMRLFHTLTLFFLYLGPNVY